MQINNSKTHLNVSHLPDMILPPPQRGGGPAPTLRDTALGNAYATNNTF